MRTSIYIDGLNLYYLALKGTSYKWLDLKQMALKLLQPHHQITQIKYFTSIVSGRLNPRQPIRQKTYLRALKKYIPEISIYRGFFLSHDVYRPRSPLTNPPDFVKIRNIEEKESDVKLAAHLINDAWLNRYDCAVIVSNDSDLAEPLRLIREQNDKRVGLIPPLLYGSATRELKNHAHFIKHVRKGVLQDSQLPSPIPGTTIHKPSTW